MKKTLLSLLIISTAHAADMDTVNLFDNQYKLMQAIDKRHVISTIETPSGASIQVIDGGINMDNVDKADTFKIINDRLLLINKSSKLNPTL